MRLLAGITIGIGLCILWHHTWRAFLGWALSRGDTGRGRHGYHAHALAHPS